MAMKGLLFDLDGTLVDTAIDMLAALRILAAENSIEINPDYHQYKELITRGSRAIVESVFGQVEQSHFKILQQRYLKIYQEILTEDSSLFTGVNEVINQLDYRGIEWGIVTNKPVYLARPLIQSLPTLANCKVLVGGDSTSQAKPHPMPLHHALKSMNISPALSWYIGDAKSDITAGRAAGMKTAVALWGYIAHDEDPNNWQADKLLSQTKQLLTL